MSKLLRTLLFAAAAAAGFTLVFRTFSGRRIGSSAADASGGRSAAGRHVRSSERAGDPAKTGDPEGTGNSSDHPLSRADLIDAMPEEHQQQLLDELDQHL